MPDTLECYPLCEETIVGKIVDGEAVLVLPQEGLVKVLNEVGARIWDLSDGSNSVKDIAGIICKEYEVESSQAESDVVEFVEVMAKNGMIELLVEPVGT